MGMKDSSTLQQAVRSAAALVEQGMVIGLGSGPAAALVINCIGGLCRKGKLKDISAIPSSIISEDNIRSWGIPVSSFKDHPRVDITLDGACELDGHLNLIKTEGTFLQEKILAQASRKNVYIVSGKAISDKLGTLCKIPVEVAPFARETAQAYLENLGAVVNLRTNVIAKAFRTVHHNLILDAEFGPLNDPAGLAQKLADHAGIVSHGMFLGLATDVFVAEDAGVRYMRKEG
jgi:ribose 5-phosphate isomerase A